MPMSEAQSADAIAQSDHALPLVIAVTGHRNLLESEITEIRLHVTELLVNLAECYPDRRLLVMSSLAEGADQLVAEEAVQLGIPLIVPLPMPRELYVKDFDSLQVRETFDFLSSRATETYELPVTPGNTLESISEYGGARDQQYAQVGVFLCAHCHIP